MMKVLTFPISRGSIRFRVSDEFPTIGIRVNCDEEKNRVLILIYISCDSFRKLFLKIWHLFLYLLFISW